MDTTPRLPSLRSRVLFVFFIFGLLIALVSILAVTFATSIVMAVPILLSLLGLVSYGGWQLGDYLTKDIHALAKAIEHETPGEIVRGERVQRMCEAKSAEVQELCTRFEQFTTEVSHLAGGLRGEVDTSQKAVTEATKSLHNFMYQLAHTLRTPLNQIRWSVELLKNEESGEVTQAQREFLDTLEHSTVDVLRSAGLMLDTLVVLRNEKLSLKSQPCDVRGIVESVAGKWAVPARRKNIKLNCTPPARHLPMILGDEDRIRQVVDTLVDNAIRYTPNGKIITISFESIDEKTSKTVRKDFSIPTSVNTAIGVCVSDQGIGIPKEDLPNLFQPFYRASNAKQQWVDGNGVSLTLAHAVVSSLGGMLSAQSRLGQGTNMRFWLPGVDEAARRQASPLVE